MSDQYSETAGTFNDAELETLGLLRSNDSARTRFFAEHRDQLRKLATCRITNQLNRRLDASDILQEAFIEYSARVGAYLDQPRIPPLVWLRRLVRQIVYRKTRDNLDAKCRDVRREQYLADESAVDIDVVTASLSSVGHGLEHAEIHEKIRNLLLNMSETEREILSLIHYEGRTCREAAMELGIQFEAAKKRYSRALDRLRTLCATDLLEYGTVKS